MATGFPIIFAARGAWTPAQIQTNLWLDANDAQTIILNGTTVSQWNDKSGNGRNAVQASAAAQPTYGATSFNGMPGISFDGIDDILKTSSNVGISGAAPRTLAYTYFDTNVDREAAIQIGTDSTLRAFGRDIAGGGLLYHWASDLPMAVPSGGTSNLEVLQSTGSVSTGFLNGTQIAQGNYALDTADNPIGIGGRSPPQFGGAVFTAITFSEIILVPSVLSNDIRQKLEGYFAWKWGLQSRLPASHPYKNSPP